MNSDLYFEFLTKNKTELENSFMEDEELESTKGGKDYGVRISKIIRSKEFKLFKQFTEDDIEYIVKVNERILDGAVPKGILKNIWDKINASKNPGAILTVIRANLPYEFIRKLSETKVITDNVKKEVVLSELFIN